MAAMKPNLQASSLQPEHQVHLTAPKAKSISQAAVPAEEVGATPSIGEGEVQPISSSAPDALPTPSMLHTEAGSGRLA